MRLTRGGRASSAVELARSSCGRRRVHPQLASSLELADWTADEPAVRRRPSATVGRESSQVLADH